MNKSKYFLMFIFIYISIFSYHHPIPGTTISGNIILNSTKPLQEHTVFNVYYNGDDGKTTSNLTMDFQTLYFEFRTPVMPPIIHILITERPSLPGKDEVPITALKTNKQYPYRLFKLTMQNTYNKEKKQHEYNWLVAEINHTNPEITIPDNTVIVYMKADIFDKLETMPSLAHNHNNSFIKLPTTITKQISPALLADAGKNSVFNAQDFMPFHKKPTDTIILCDSRHLVSIPNTNQQSVNYRQL